MDDLKHKLIELRDELERLADTGESSAAVVELDQARERLQIDPTSRLCISCANAAE